MTTAEKAAELEAKGEPWPDCECHGEPMSWNRDPTRSGGGRFRCRPNALAWRRRFHEQRRQSGVCTQCGHSELGSATMCQRCADKHADLMNSPEQYLKHRARLADYRAEARADEGFRPTGAGQAALLTLLQRTATGE